MPGIIVIGYLVSAWVAWLTLTSILVASGDGIVSVPYLAFTAAITVLSVWQIQASRKRRHEWSTRHHDL